MQPLLAITGILTRASEAKEKTEEAQEKEGLELAVTSSQMEDVNTLEITEEKLSNAIKQQFGNDKDFSITDNRDGSFLVTMNNTNRMYYIEETGEIIDQSKMMKINTADELKVFRDDVNSGNTYEGWYVYLENDITLDINEKWEPIGYYAKENSNPENENNRPFKGIFDGRHHEINGIYITSSDKVNGLFGWVNNGKILNLGMGENCTITCTNDSVGGICGYLYNGGKIVNSYNKCNITAKGYIGGIVGQAIMNCSIVNCYNQGNISGETEKIAGICGNFTKNSYVKNCYNNGIINGFQFVGGIVGYSSASNINNCYNANNIIGNSKIGSIIVADNNNNVINNCYYLENTVNGANDTEVQTGVIVVTSEKLKNLANALGDNYKEDVNNINNGYPILQWQ